jgi:hypothetical protein
VSLSKQQKSMGRSWWAACPLDRLFSGITVIVLVFLCIVMALAARQYLLYRQCQQAVAAGDQLLYQFTSIKSHLSESLVTMQEINLQNLNNDLRHLEQAAETLSSNILVPESLKPALFTRADLVGLEVRLRAMRDRPREPHPEKAELIRSLNTIDVGMQQFRLLLGEYTQTILLGLHKIIAGALGLIVALTCCLLFMLNRYLAAPVLDLCRRTDAQNSGDDGATCSLNGLSQQIDIICTRHERSASLLTVVGGLAALLADPDNGSHPWKNVCTLLGAVPEHVFVWVGVVHSAAPSPIFLHSTCSSSENSDEHLRQIERCCRKNSEFCRSAHQSIVAATPTAHTFPSTELPPSLRSLFPESSRGVTALSIPLLNRETVQRVVTLYSLTPGCFDRENILLLEHLLTSLNVTFQQPKAPQGPISSSPERRRRHALRFRYAAAGWIGSEIAAEITNGINGVLNYTQTLMDLEGQKSNRPQRDSLLQALMKEEKKIVGLVTGMQQLFSGQQPGSGHTSLSALFHMLTLVLDKRLRTEAITCTFPEQYPDVIHIPAGDLWLVLLTLVQSGRRALNQADSVPPGKKNLVIACLNQTTEKDHLILQFTNTASSWPEAPAPESAIWPSLAFCRHLLRLHGGDISRREEDHRTNAILLRLPSRTSTI